IDISPGVSSLKQFYIFREAFVVNFGFLSLEKYPFGGLLSGIITREILRESVGSIKLFQGIKM
ncbi:MAG: hypothetical protein MR912_09970, partial [Prevotella sp.]|nr:hypothetical protein [Prevotella sp.]